MRKSNRRLVLGRETLRSLAAPDLAPLAQVVAGASGGVVSCVCSTPKGCDTYDTCTTHLC